LLAARPAPPFAQEKTATANHLFGATGGVFVLLAFQKSQKPLHVHLLSL
jgi:hypothetical protein